jgi:hypothetical protein
MRIATLSSLLSVPNWTHGVQQVIRDRIQSGGSVSNDIETLASMMLRLPNR